MSSMESPKVTEGIQNEENINTLEDAPLFVAEILHSVVTGRTK